MMESLLSPQIISVTKYALERKQCFALFYYIPFVFIRTVLSSNSWVATFLDLLAIIVIASATADIADTYVQSELTFWRILTPCRSHSWICEYACYVAVNVITACHCAAVERYVFLIINNGIVSDCLMFDGVSGSKVSCTPGNGNYIDFFKWAK
jgi:hypothetical protein